jgi:hypothetical protein
MRPKKHATTKSGDLFRARLDQIIDLKHGWHSSQERARSHRSTARRPARDQDALCGWGAATKLPHRRAWK